MTCWYGGRLGTWISARLRKFLYNVLQVKIVLRPISALLIHKNHQLQPGVSIKLLHSFSSEKYKKIQTLFFVVVFLVSLAHKNKSVKLKMHKHKKSNVCKISVRKIKREKNYKTSIYSSLKELSRSSTTLSS